MTLLILAAGLGSRYGGNKQFDGVGTQEEYLLEYTMYDAIKAGIQRIVVVTRKEAMEEVTNYFEERLPHSVDLVCVAQSLEDVPSGYKVPGKRIKPWGTAHAVWSARDVIEGKFATVNADDLYGRKGVEAAANCMRENPQEGAFGLVGYRLSEVLSAFGTVSRGICRAKEGFLTSVVEHTKLRRSAQNQIVDEVTSTTFTGEELTSMNLWIADSSIFSAIESYFLTYFREPENVESGELYLPLIVQKLIDNKKAEVKLIDSNSNWHGMTYKADKEKLSEVLSSLTDKKLLSVPAMDQGTDKCYWQFLE